LLIGQHIKRSAAENGGTDATLELIFLPLYYKQIVQKIFDIQYNFMGMQMLNQICPCIGKTKSSFILVQVQFRLLTRAALKISAVFNLSRARQQAGLYLKQISNRLSEDAQNLGESKICPKGTMS